MRVASVHAGTAVYAFKSMLRELGGELVPPPPNSNHTLSLGTRYSPEMVCLPFKLILGNFIEALELGADTLVMPTSYGPCRMGYYARTHQRILTDLGYRFEMVTFGGPAGILAPAKKIFTGVATWRIIRSLAFGLAKLAALDALEQAARSSRATEQERGSATHLLQRATQAVDDAADYATLKRVKRDYLAQFQELPKEEREDPLRIAILGEIFVVMDSFSNHDIELELGRMGVVVRRAPSWWWWLKGTRIPAFLAQSDDKKLLRQAATAYLRDDIGGEAWETVGGKTVYYRQGYDGLIHLLPFTCMPEIVAQNIMAATREQFPVLTILCDEQTGKAGLLTRLEAFVDLLQARRRRLNLMPKGGA